MASREIKKLGEEKQRREFFNGKKTLMEFYKKHLHQTGMPKEMFIYACAQEASERTSVNRFVQELFKQMGIRILEEPSGQAEASAAPEEDTG